ncbi:MAG: hypothetical protein ACR5KW_03345 [Wolbachia sp.]
MLSFIFSIIFNRSSNKRYASSKICHYITKKKKIVEQLNTDIMKQTAQLRQIIEIQEEVNINESNLIQKRKKSIGTKPEDTVMHRKKENEIKNEKSIESKKNELIVAEIINSIREKLTKCWNIPERIIYKENFSIKINLLLSNQGEIIMTDIVDSSSYKNNSLFRSIADSAMRAAYKCSPITNLPIKYYHIWREVTLDFILNG